MPRARSGSLSATLGLPQSLANKMSGTTQQHRKAAVELAKLLSTLEEGLRENARLKHHLAYVESGINLLDNEHAQQVHQELLVRLAHTRPCKAMPMLTADHPLAAQAGSHQGIVSVWALPDPGRWDHAFEQRLRSLSTLDMLLLHRQYLRETAMLLPKAESSGPGLPDYQRLLTLMDRYAAFNQNAMTLAHDAWVQRSCYNIETLDPVEPASREVFVDTMARRRRKGQISDHLQEMQATLTRLRGEYNALSARHRELLALLGLQQGPGASPCHMGMGGPSRQPSSSSLGGPHGATYFSASHQPLFAGHGQQWQACSPESSASPATSHNCVVVVVPPSRAGRKAGLREVVELMHANLSRQRMAMRHCLHALWQAQKDQHCVEVAKAWLLMYPLPYDIVDFFDSTMGTGMRRRQDGGSPGCSVSELS